MYAVPVAGSITGVAVTPTDGVRSAHPMSAGFQGVPWGSVIDHLFVACRRVEAVDVVLLGRHQQCADPSSSGCA